MRGGTQNVKPRTPEGENALHQQRLRGRQLAAGHQQVSHAAGLQVLPVRKRVEAGAVGPLPPRSLNHHGGAAAAAAGGGGCCSLPRSQHGAGERTVQGTRRRKGVDVDRLHLFRCGGTAAAKQRVAPEMTLHNMAREHEPMNC